ncbi:hypothetical protein PHJA_000292600 [Phtheirospermum japonicum]|uniref:Uncharacterized protein n=1 Tax=Phtheirospermum japonicum TaxID=374723 RepID=A0A830BAT4_9LAMI|nr:hypothetical protein PHJA_000292600 [Phtheirospermum japonicum]
MRILFTKHLFVFYIPKFMSLYIIVFPTVLLNRYWCIVSLKTIILDITHSCMAKHGRFLSAQYRL